jgi:anti-anti-sigma factor
VARPDELELELEHHPSGAVVVRVMGEVDLATVSEMEKALAASSSSQQVVVDLTECTFLDSSALHVLLASAASAEDPNGFAIVAPEGGVRRLLEISGANATVPLHTTLEEALPHAAGAG